MVDDRRMDNDRRRRTDDDGPWLYCKLTNKPKGSGELKMIMFHAYNEHDNELPKI